MTTHSRDHLMVSVDELHRQLQGSAPPLVLDVRWRMGDRPGAGRDRYLAGHIPGSRHVAVEDVFSGEPQHRTEGRHPLPDPDRLGAGLAAAGMAPGRRIVVADEPGTFAAERAWWVLRWAGLDVRLLDGGVPAWRAAGFELDQAELKPADEEPMALRPGAMRVVTADGAAEAGSAADRTLIDVRAPERYRGQAEPIDPVAGHIPGAVNLPVAALFDADGTLPDEATLNELLEPERHPHPTLYCGSGVSAARGVLAFAALGVEAELFAGSWSAWCNDPFRPVARGENA